MRKLLSVVAAGSLLAGCADAGAPIDRGFEGPGINLNIAALNLQGVGDVVWDLQVVNGAATAQTVWEQRITSSQYGDSAGSASYVGPCDADPTDSTEENTVNVWVVGVYDADIADPGTFNDGDDATVVLGSANAVPFQNPTSVNPLSRTFTCLENQDVFVQFDVALMRPAQQGFFDIAVNFNSIFCSAKFDCAYEAAAETGDCATPGPSGTCTAPAVLNNPLTACASDADCVRPTDINLLHNTGGGRGQTYILGFACTAGADTATSGAGDRATKLYLDNLTLVCGASNEHTFYVNTSTANDGNLCDAGFATCDNISATNGTFTTGSASAVAATYLFQAAVYSGNELLEAGTGLSYNKGYWNVAVGVKAAASATGAGCTLVTKGTAEDSTNAGDNVDGGHIANGSVYPFITWNVDFETCGAEPLMFGTAGAMVATDYTTTTLLDRDGDTSIEVSDINGAGGNGHDDLFFNWQSPAND